MTLLTVIGDAFLDLDWVGTVSRVAPDAPTPILDDHEGALVHQILAEAGVTVVDLGLGGTTPVELRLRVPSASVARVDGHCGTPAPVGQWTSTAATAVREASALLVSDYDPTSSWKAPTMPTTTCRNAPSCRSGAAVVLCHCWKVVRRRGSSVLAEP